MHEVRIACAAVKSVFTNFAAATTVAATVAATATLHYEATMQAAAPELRCVVVQRGREAAGVALATTAAKWATLLRSARISSGMGPLLRRSSREKPLPTDARFGVAGPYHC